MVNKITTPPTTSELIGKVNEIIDDKQDTLVSGTNIRTVGGTSLLGSGNIAFPTIDSALSTSSTNAVQNKVITSALNGKAEDNLVVHLANTETITGAKTFENTSTNASNIAITLKSDNLHKGTNPSSNSFNSIEFTDVNNANICKFSAIQTSDGWTGFLAGAGNNPTSPTGNLLMIASGTNKLLLIPPTTSHTSCAVRRDFFNTEIAKYTPTASLATVAISGNYNDLSNKPTIPTVNNATLTIQKNGTNVATFTANASNNVTANISVPNVTSTYTATGTDAVNGVAVSNAIATKQDNLVSGTNIKTINGTSILGSGNITIETSSTPNVDGETISYNSSDALQTIAVKNVRDNSTLPIWQGTETQWNQGVATTWYYWQTSVTALWASGGSLPSYASWYSVTYGDGKFVAVTTDSSIKSAYSTDGINWTASTLPSSADWASVTYGDGKFVAVAHFLHRAAYSTDGINWTASILPSSADWASVTYGDGKFVAVASSSDKSAYSTDGINWTASILPSYASWASVTYGDGKFVAVASSSDKSAYSTDGINWTASTLPSYASWASVTYGDGKFVAVASSSDKSAYSTDGINWTASTLPSYASWYSVTYGDGKFVAVARNSIKSAYSTDGINWTASTLPSSADWASVTYGDGKFVAVALSSDTTAIFTIQYDSCYTETSNPTTASTVYSEPETQSALTVSSVTSGAITLSNNNTYYYNQSGNAYTYQSIGVAHPEYLCFIDGVGVKIGTTTIATNS